MIRMNLSDADTARERDQTGLIERYPLLAPMIAAADALDVNETEALGKYLIREVERFAGLRDDE